RFVWTVIRAATAPTRRMSRKSGHRKRTSAKERRATRRPGGRYATSATLPATKRATPATAPRATPRRGNNPQPKMRHGDRGISAAAPTDVTTAGTAMLPVPRITLASELKTQIRIAPEETTVE